MRVYFGNGEFYRGFIFKVFLGGFINEISYVRVRVGFFIFFWDGYRVIFR